MKQYQTKTGINLSVIKGEGQGNGIPRGFLKLLGKQLNVMFYKCGSENKYAVYQDSTVMFESGDYEECRAVYGQICMANEGALMYG